MVGRDDSKPLATVEASPATAEDLNNLLTAKKLLRRRRILCCSGCAAIMMVIAILILILSLTVFKVKDPEIRMNSITINSLKISLASALVAVNISVTANISVKNPNAATFRFRNCTTSVVYRGDTVGVALLPAGKARARRTMNANVTLVVLADRLVGGGLLPADLFSGSVPVSTHTNVGGKVKILGIFKKHVNVILNCNMVIAVANQSILSQICERKVKL